VTRFITLADAAQSDLHRVGSKARGLGRLIEGGFRVPDGFVIPPDVDPNDVADLLVGALGGDDAPYAYRSSAAAEDLSTASFAGQYETVLGVVGPAAGAEAVARVRASAHSAAVDAYRDRSDAPDRTMAVIVQRQIDARVSGVAFSRDPVTGADVVVVGTAAGVGDALMSGTVTPEEWTVASEPQLRTRAGEPVLTVDEAAGIARLCRDVEASLGGPQDIEWAIDDSGIWLLQARPITALPLEPTSRPNPKTAWERSDAFFPDPITPLAYSAWMPTHTEATGRAFELLGIPSGGMAHGYYWGRVYDRIIPLIGGESDAKGLPPAPILRLVMRVHPGFRARMKTAATAARTDLPIRFIEAWEQEGRDRIRSRTRELRSIDLAALADGELADHLSDIRGHAFECGLEHFKLVFGGWVLVGQLGMLARDLAGWEPERVIDLVQGHGEATRAEGEALAAVCEAVAASPAPESMLDGSADLRADPGPAGAALRAFLYVYGHRSHASLTQPTWAEDPAPVLALIRSRLDGDARVIPDLKPAAAGALEELLSSVSGEEERERLARAVSRARLGRPYGDETERDPGEAMGLVHYAAMEAARRFVATGRLRERDDVAFFEFDELVEALRGGPIDRDVIARRKAEHRWALANPAPRTMGPEGGDHPDPDLFPPTTRPIAAAFMWAVGNLFFTSRFEPGTDGSLSGLPASAGTAEGTARIVRGSGDFDRIKPGDVVVCPSTMASWSPIFPVIGGLVTEVGGPLSHPGTLAREFGLPAVLAVADATSLIEDGSRIRIDGARGTVTML
jgi:pyruvate,water dikinase